MRTQANSAVCNFFALLKDDTVRKIDLLQAITNNIKSCFIDNSTKLMDSETEEILFDGNFNIDGNEVLYVEFPLSDTLLEANTNSIPWIYQQMRSNHYSGLKITYIIFRTLTKGNCYKIKMYFFGITPPMINCQMMLL